MQITPCWTVDVNNAASGDTTILAATAATSDGIPGLPIKVWKMVLDSSGGANTVIFKGGTTAITPTVGLNLLANQTYEQGADGVPLFVVPAGLALVMNLSAATLVKGTIYYTNA